LIDYIEGRRQDWPFSRPPLDYLFADGFSWPGRKKRGLFQFSLAILFPLLLMIVYLLSRLVLWSG